MASTIVYHSLDMAWLLIAGTVVVGTSGRSADLLNESKIASKTQGMQKILK